MGICSGACMRWGQLRKTCRHATRMCAWDVLPLVMLLGVLQPPALVGLSPLRDVHALLLYRLRPLHCCSCSLAAPPSASAASTLLCCSAACLPPASTPLAAPPPVSPACPAGYAVECRVWEGNYSSEEAMAQQLSILQVSRLGNNVSVGDVHTCCAVFQVTGKRSAPAASKGCWQGCRAGAANTCCARCAARAPVPPRQDYVADPTDWIVAADVDELQWWGGKFVK